MTSLLDLPEVPLRALLERCNYVSIQHLRKVCHDLRNFIDEKKTFSIPEVTIICKSDEIYLLFNVKEPLVEDQKIFELKYQKNKRGCTIVRKYNEEEKSKFLKNCNFTSLFMRDFKCVLEQRENVLDCFNLNITSGLNRKMERNFMKKLEAIVESEKLQVKHIILEMAESEPIRSFLSCFEAESIEKLNFSCNKGDPIEFDIEEFGKLDQWKHAKDLTTDDFKFSVSNENLTHFSSVKFFSWSIDNDLIPNVKQTFLNSKAPQHFEVIFNDNYGDHVIAALGPPSQRFQQLDNGDDVEYNQDKKWFFKVPNSDKVLWIELRFEEWYIYLIFESIDSTKVPFGYEIKN